MKSLFCIPSWVLVILGILFGAATGLLWNFGFIQSVRAMIPYALIFAIILFVITAFLKARCGNTAEDLLLTSACSSLRKYFPAIVIAAVIFIVFTFVVMAAAMSFTVSLILAFIGSIAFWTMLIEFVAMLFCMWYRR